MDGVSRGSSGGGVFLLKVQGKGNEWVCGHGQDGEVILTLWWLLKDNPNPQRLISSAMMVLVGDWVAK